MTELFMPKYGLTMEEGTVSKWLKKEGEPVKKGEPLVEIIADKATIELESPVDGILTKILVNENETVPVTTILAYLADK